MPVAPVAVFVVLSVNAAPRPALVRVVWAVPESLVCPSFRLSPEAAVAASGWVRRAPKRAARAPRVLAKRARRDRGETESTAIVRPSRTAHRRPSGTARRSSVWASGIACRETAVEALGPRKPWTLLDACGLQGPERLRHVG